MPLSSRPGYRLNVSDQRKIHRNVVGKMVLSWSAGDACPSRSALNTNVDNAEHSGTHRGVQHGLPSPH